MIDKLKQILGFGPKADYGQLMKEGATIIDVRSKGEFKSGHIKGSTNIPLDELNSKLGKLNRGKPLIVCCASGMRSGTAKGILKSKGFKEVYNGGGWRSLQGKIR